jgi:transposase InsO family protein
MVKEAIDTQSAGPFLARLHPVLTALGVPRSSWYRRRDEAGRKPGPVPRPVAPELVQAIESTAGRYPWWGYKRIAVVLRRAGVKVSNKIVYRVMKAAGLLQKRRSRQAEVYQTARLLELLPRAPNDLWQADVTYVHVPGHGWWYAVTVIDYFSRYLLACHFTPSYRAADVARALDLARAEAECLHGPLEKTPFLVTDNGPSFIARSFRRHIEGRYAQVRIQYRTPTQLGLLERFHQTLKQEEVYWNLYANPAQARESLEVFRRRYNEIRPHWALVPTEGRDPLTPADVYVGRQPVRLPRWQGWARAAKEKLEQMIDGAHLPVPVLEEGPRVS